MLNVILFLLLAFLYIFMIGLTMFCWVEIFTDFDLLGLFIALALTLLVLLPVGFIYDEHSKAKSTTETTIVEVEVIEKNYSPATTTMVMSGKVFVPIHKSERYNIKISDGDLEQSINNKDMYSKLDVGDRFQMNKIVYKNKKNNVFEQEFQLIGSD